MADDCLGDRGYREGERIRAEAVSYAGNIKQVAAIAIAIDNAAQLVSNYRDQRDIADRTMKLSEQAQSHLRETYWPRELQFLGEFGSPEDLEDAEALGRRYGGRLVASAADAFAKEFKQLDCMASRYCTSARSKSMQDLMIVRAQTLANQRVLGRMMAFAEIQAERDTNEGRRRQAIALGRDLMGDAASFYKNAGGGLAAVGNSLSNSLSSALEMFGSARRDPGITSEMQGMLMRSGGLSASTARMPPVGGALTTPYFDGSSVTNANSQMFITEPVGGLLSVDAASSAETGVSGSGAHYLAQNSSMSNWNGLQNERWNEGDVGNRDLARSGSKEYDFVDSDGNTGSITVNMSDFPLIYVDDKTQGDS